MRNIVAGLTSTNVMIFYAMGCLYQEELKAQTLRFMIKHAECILDSSFSFTLQYQLCGLRDCDVQDFLCSEELLVQDESLVYNFIKCWKEDHHDNWCCDAADMDTIQKQAQALFKSCVRWSCMPLEQIWAIAAEEIVEPEILHPYLLKPQTTTPRLSEPVQARDLRLQEESAYHRKYQLTVPVANITGNVSILFKGYTAKFSMRVAHHLMFTIE